MITDAKEFGLCIKAQRKKLGYTQAYVSEFSGLSVSFLSDLEGGKSTCELGKAIYVANILGLDLALIGRGEKLYETYS